MFHIIVRTKYQYLIDSFLKSFLENKGNYAVKLYVVYMEKDNIVIPKIDGVYPVPSSSLGTAAYLPIIYKIIDEVGLSRKPGNYGYLGILNDDLLFSPQWLKDVEEGLGQYDSVSPGYINTRDREKFHRALEKSSNVEGVVPLLTGACMFFRMDMFPKIGMLDPQFDWACEDMDIAWRLELNNMPSVTLKKITVMHFHGESRVKELKRWNAESDKGKAMFYNKHGVESYRRLVERYKGHAYFINYDC